MSSRAWRNIRDFGLMHRAGRADRRGAEADARRRSTAPRQSDRARRREQKFGLDYEHDDTNQRVWNVLSRDPVFEDLAEHPTALAFVQAVLGWPALLGNISANITGPGGGEMVLHADQIFVPEPWAGRSAGRQRGLVRRRLHRGQRRDVLRARQPPAQPGAAARRRGPRDRADGGAGRLARRVREPGLAPDRQQPHRPTKRRAGVFAWYTRPIYRAQENWFLSLRPESASSPRDELLVLLGYKTVGLGLVNGASPA